MYASKTGLSVKMDTTKLLKWPYSQFLNSTQIQPKQVHIQQQQLHILKPEIHI